jgi:hypothetical protein
LTGSPLPRVTRLPLYALAAACAGLTALALPPVRDAVGRVIGAAAEPGPAAWELVLSAVLALAAAVVVWVKGPVPLGTPWSDWLQLEAAARFLIVRPVDRLASALAAFDDRVLDRAVNGSARGALQLARWTNRQAERRIDGVVEGVATASRVLGRWARRPQTGQLHQYLAQAVAAFTVLAVVIVFVR